MEHRLECKRTRDQCSQAAALARMLVYVRDAAIEIDDLEAVALANRLIAKIGCCKFTMETLRDPAPTACLATT